MRLAGKVAVITGGGSGIGAAAATLFAQEGAKLCLVDRDAAGLERVAASIGADVLTCVSDVGETGAAETDAQAILTRWGRIDVLLTAAGVSPGGTALTVDPAAWDTVMRVNVTGTWLWARAVLPTMIAQHSGSIITVASQLAKAGGRNNIAYITSKGAVLSLTKTMALDHAPDGIRVNTILPGATETPMLRRSFGRAAEPDTVREASRRRHPMARFGRPEEIAAAALYLASDESSFTTGLEMVVDGGWLIG